MTGEHRKPENLDDLEDRVDGWLLIGVGAGVILVAVIAVIAIWFVRR